METQNGGIGGGVVRAWTCAGAVAWSVCSWVRLLSGGMLVWFVHAAWFLAISLPLHADEKVVNMTGKQLEIQVDSARLQVDTEDRGDVRFRLVGDKAAIGAVRTSMEGGKMVLREEEAAGSSFSNSSVKTSSNVHVDGDIVVHGGSVSIGTINVPGGRGNYNQAARSLEIHVVTPRSLPLSLKSTGANIVVGKVDAPLKLDLLGHGDVRVAALRDGDITMLGTGDVEIGNVAGNLKVRSVGTGNLTVREGQIGRLLVDIQGTGNVTVDGTAQDAVIRSTGTGDITVRAAQHPVIEQRSGVGSIEIGGVSY